MLHSAPTFGLTVFARELARTLRSGNGQGFRATTPLARWNRRGARSSHGAIVVAVPMIFGSWVLPVLVAPVHADQRHLEMDQEATMPDRDARVPSASFADPPWLPSAAVSTTGLLLTACGGATAPPSTTG